METERDEMELAPIVMVAMTDDKGELVFGTPAEAAAAAKTLDLTPAMAMPPSILRTTVTVPDGFVMPCGNPLTDGFTLVVEYGARWHPEWASPQMTVNGSRFMAAGDQLVWAGDSIAAFASLLPEAVVTMSMLHGQPATEYMATEFGITIPTKPQEISTFLTVRPYQVN